MTLEELLRANKISLPSTARGRYYTTCPQCSHKRSKARQVREVLGVTIDGNGVNWAATIVAGPGRPRATAPSTATLLIRP